MEFRNKNLTQKIFKFFITIFFIFQKTKSFLIISMSLLYIDDCIEKIYFEDVTILYKRSSGSCAFDHFRYNNPIVSSSIPYDIGQIIYVEIGDISTECGIKMSVNVNNNPINPENINYWGCTNCEGASGNYIYDSRNQRLLCYVNSHPWVEGSHQYYNFKYYFQIKSLSELGFYTSEYTYYLTKQNYYYISPPNLDQKIDLIDLYSINNLHAKNDQDQIITPFYQYIKYKLTFDNYFSSYSGKFIGTDKDNNDIELNENIFSFIFQNKNLRYELSESEKRNNGVHLRLKIGIYNNQDKLVSNLEDFNFFICLNGYKFCDIETSMKCLKEGYYESNHKYYSCYETCDNCNTYKKPESSNYFKNYCDSCKSNFSYFVNVVEEENGNIKNYKSCYEECPIHAPYLKDKNNKECISQ